MTSFYLPEKITVMLLAAGEGRRMLPLTQTTPKPLLKIGKRPLIEHHLSNLASFGFKNIIINTAYLASMIQNHIGDGSQFNLNINYSDESTTGALETAGGIINAIHLIKSDPFLVINADIWTDFKFSDLLKALPEKNRGRLALVNNPEHNQSGDFCIDNDNALCLKKEDSSNSYTFSGMALYKKSIFTELTTGKQPLAPILRKLIAGNELENIIYQGSWTDVGTPERLQEINSNLTN